MEPLMYHAALQTDVYSYTGTGTQYFNGSIYDGTGVKIGVIESSYTSGYGGRYDSSAAQIVDNSNITFVENVMEDGSTVPYVTENHATKMTSIIAGSEKVVNGYAYKGIVPNATVYQTSAKNSSQMRNAVKMFAEMGVHVINYSAGAKGNGTYTSSERELDNLISNMDLTVVIAAGNQGNSDTYVTSPGKAYNVITVGNAETKTDLYTMASEPYSIFNQSSYEEAEYLTNKPDIVAPGTYIGFVKTEEQVLLTGSGTSTSAPFVTGIVAQMLQRNTYLRANPTAVKAALMLGADSSRVVTDDNALIPYTNLREKSGAGFVSATNAVRNTYDAKFSVLSSAQVGTASPFGRFYLNAGETVNAMMVFNKKNNKLINSASDLDNIHRKLLLYIILSK